MKTLTKREARAHEDHLEGYKEGVEEMMAHYDSLPPETRARLQKGSEDQEGWNV